MAVERHAYRGESAVAPSAIAMAMLLAIVGCDSTAPTPIPPLSPSPTPPQTCPNATGDPNTSSPPVCLTFAGYEWVVKASRSMDPGPNAWSDAAASVWVDAQGLHLTIRQVGSTWFASEVILNRSLGYGKYVFQTVGAVDHLDPNAVLGLFTYDYGDPAFAHREIDIEFSPSLFGGTTGHFTVQPFAIPGNSHNYSSNVGQGPATHAFEWRSNRIAFQSGTEGWTYAGGSIPVPGAENTRMNLWLFDGRPPTDGRPIEVVVTGFQFIP